MPTTRTLILHASLFAAALLAAPAGAQTLQDGNMDALTPGTPPDNATYAGAWGFPAVYISNAVAEPVGRETMYTIVPTTTFQPGAGGNSLHMLSLNVATTENYHLPNVWTPAITAAPGLIIRVTFNMWVTTGAGGGAFYVGGDNGGGGFSNATGDRTAQLAWTTDGQINYTNNTGTNVPIHAYSFDGWQNVRIDIDTTAHTYNLFWSMGANPLTQIGTNLMFRAPDPTLSVHYDRVTYVQFGATVPSVNSYIDNIVVTPIPPCGSADFDCDGDVGTDADIEAFFRCLGGNCPPPPCPSNADFNGDGDVGTDADIEAFFRVLGGGTC
jgi:hypothetical protein